MYDLRKSCDQCSRLKKKCDGNQPSCSRCMGKGVGEVCSYSNRRARTRTTYRKRRATCTPTAGGVAGAQATKVEATHRGSVDIVLKRCRLSVSPATGLVGMEENSFLSDFFSCVGFLPLTTTSDIREAMVKIMGSAALQQPTPGEEFGMDGKLDAMRGIENAMEHGQFPADPSFCTFWSAVAIGALVKGSPIESVERYVRLAQAALSCYPGPANIEVLKARTILGYLHFFVGDQAKFHECLQLSDTYIHHMVEKGSDDALPVGFPEVVKHGETIKLFTCKADTEEVESLLSQDVPFPEACGVQTQEQLCKYMISSYRAFELRIYKDVHQQKATAPPRASNVETINDGASKQCGTGRQLSGARSSSGTSHLFDICPDLLVEMAGKLKGRMLGAGQLEDAVDWYSSRHRWTVDERVSNQLSDVPELDRTLIMERAIQGDARGALQRLERCIEIIERYPGLTRSAMGTHMSHVMMSTVANIQHPKARELYEKLRIATNLARSPGSLQFPPLEEWQGMSAFCDNLPCRCIEAVMRQKMLALHAPSEFAKARGRASAPGVLHNISRLEPLMAPPAGFAVVAGSDPRSHQEDGVRPDSVAAAFAAETMLSTPGLDYSIDEEMPDNFVAAEDWLDVTHAMLNNIDP